MQLKARLLRFHIDRASKRCVAAAPRALEAHTTMGDQSEQARPLHLEELRCAGSAVTSQRGGALVRRFAPHACASPALACAALVCWWSHGTAAAPLPIVRAAGRCSSSRPIAVAPARSCCCCPRLCIRTSTPFGPAFPRPTPQCTHSFDNLVLRALPVEEGPNAPRPVAGACFSRTAPAPLRNPRLVAAAPGALRLLGLDPDEVRLGVGGGAGGGQGTCQVLQTLAASW